MGVGDWEVICGRGDDLLFISCIGNYLCCYESARILCELRTIGYEDLTWSESPRKVPALIC